MQQAGMEFIRHAEIMVPMLSGLSMTVWEGEDGPLRAFEGRFCFLPGQQRLYTRQGLLDFFAKKDDSRIYVLEDALDTGMVLVQIRACWVLLGPYVTTEWEEGRAKVALARCGLGEAQHLPYKLYRCQLPLVERGYAIRIAGMLLANTTEYTVPREMERICLQPERTPAAPVQLGEQYEALELVNRRYSIEHQFMEAVSRGRATEAIRLRQELGKATQGLRFLGKGMQDQITAAAMQRTLVRQAALQGGLAPVVVDAVSQEYAQKMHAATGQEQLDQLLLAYIDTFCRAVRNNNKSNYSLYVKRAVQYITLHLSEEIPVETLCQLSGISRRYFVELFGRETGQTVKQYIAHARCRRAAELLANSSLQIQEISHYVGYEDNNYFAKVFKQVMGMTPQEYRRREKI